MNRDRVSDTQCNRVLMGTQGPCKEAQTQIWTQHADTHTRTDMERHAKSLQQTNPLIHTHTHPPKKTLTTRHAKPDPNRHTHTAMNTRNRSIWLHNNVMHCRLKNG